MWHVQQNTRIVLLFPQKASAASQMLGTRLWHAAQHVKKHKTNTTNTHNTHTYISCFEHTPRVAPKEKVWFHGKVEFALQKTSQSQYVHDNFITRGSAYDHFPHIGVV